MVYQGKKYLNKSLKNWISDSKTREASNVYVLMSLKCLSCDFQVFLKCLKFTHWLWQDSEHCANLVWEVGRCETTAKKWNPVLSAWEEDVNFVSWRGSVMTRSDRFPDPYLSRGHITSSNLDVMCATDTGKFFCRDTAFNICLSLSLNHHSTHLLLYQQWSWVVPTLNAVGRCLQEAHKRLKEGLKPSSLWACSCIERFSVCICLFPEGDWWVKFCVKKEAFLWL